MRRSNSGGRFANDNQGDFWDGPEAAPDDDWPVSPDEEPVGEATWGSEEAPTAEIGDSGPTRTDRTPKPAGRALSAHRRHRIRTCLGCGQSFRAFAHARSCSRTCSLKARRLLDRTIRTGSLQARADLALIYLELGLADSAVKLLRAPLPGQ